MSDNERLVAEARDAISPDKRWAQTEVYRTELIRRLADALELSENNRNRLLGEPFALPLPPKKETPRQDSGLVARSERADVESRTF